MKDAPALDWTDDPPTVPGWYWWRKRPGKVPSVVEIAMNDAGTHLIRTDVDERVPNPGTYGSGQWAGPIPEPKE